ncbi:MAG: alanine racemase, partial [Oscillospiraceae bacterium]
MEDKALIAAAKNHGTPSFVLDTDILRTRMREIRKMMGDIQLCYSIKANPFLVNEMAELTDMLEVCSPGEMNICKRQKINPSKIILSGVCKTCMDVEDAIAENVAIYTAESKSQLEIINNTALEKGLILPVLLRLTGGSQFGMDEKTLRDIIKHKEMYRGIRIDGIHYFVGTQRKKLDIAKSEITHLAKMCQSLYNDYGFTVNKLEYGAGLSVPYFEGDDFADTLKPLREILPYLKTLAKQAALTVEMGRFFVADCGYYLTDIVDIKQNDESLYAFCNGGINHVNYIGGTMGMKIPIIKHFALKSGSDKQSYSLCGSLCTTADILVRKKEFTSLNIGDTLCFCNIGAYSITEGLYLFLSRRLPKILIYSSECGIITARDFYDTDILNCGG